MKILEVTKAPIALFKILKIEGLSASGGAAKLAVSSGQVRVNGVVETQMRKKIVAGDLIEYGREKIRIELAP